MRRIGVTGFTIVELLVVIAIIAILAAIIFPVAARAKDAAYRSADMSNMNEIGSALALYRVDQGAYPPELFGYVQLYSGSVLPADQTLQTLFPKRISSIGVFQPAYDHVSTTETFPPQTVTSCADPQPSTGQQCVVWPGNAVSSPSSPTTNCGMRAFGSNIPVTTDLGNPSDSSAKPEYFYKVDGYDVAPVKNSDGTTRYEIHYTLFWSGYGLGISGCTTSGLAGNALDDVRQLGYQNPPNNTVVTWDTFFRDYDSNNNPLKEKRDIVLFLGGNAKLYDSLAVADNPWTVSP